MSAKARFAAPAALVIATLLLGGCAGDSSGASSAAATATEAAVERVTVPDVGGMTLAEATRTVEDAGLNVDTIGSEGEVESQAPSPGVKVERGAQVLLTLVAEDSPVAAMGEPATIAGSTLTVTSFEIVNEVPTVSGDPLVAGSGEQLVLFHTHYVNGSTQTADLSCSGAPDWYIEVLDTEQREMAPVFETYRIPGNPECNYQLLSGQESDWTFAYRQVEGATPMALQITETQTYDGFVLIDLTGRGLTVSEE